MDETPRVIRHLWSGPVTIAERHDGFTLDAIGPDGEPLRLAECIPTRAIAEEPRRCVDELGRVSVTGLPMPICPNCNVALIEGGGFILNCAALVAKCGCGYEIDLAKPGESGRTVQ